MSKARPSLSKALQLSVFRRDGWICRWCNRPVIFAPVMRLIERDVREIGKEPPDYPITTLIGLATARRYWTNWVQLSIT